MNITILSTIDFFSLDQGAARRIYHLGDNLAHCGNKVTMICLLDRRSKRERIGRTKNNAKMIGIPSSRLPMLLFSIMKYLVHTDIIQIELPHLALLIPLLKILRKPIVLDEHGVEVHAIQEIRRAQERRVGIVEYFGILLLEWLAVKASSLIFTCSDHDAKMLIEKYKVANNKVVIVPNGVDDDFFEYANSYSYDKPTIIFIGNFNHAPNVYAAKVILNKFTPNVYRRDENLSFVFVGRNPPQWLVDNGSKNCVKVFGNVKDVRPYLTGADIAIAPVYHGSGTRIKILEYMALGKPVISTSKGVEGLDVENGKHILLRDNPTEFAETIIELLLNRNLAVRLGKNGYRLVKEKYRWKNIVTMAIKAYNQLLPHK